MPYPRPGFSNPGYRTPVALTWRFMPILLSPAAFLMTLLGGLVADRVGRHRHLVLGFAAGVMLGVIAFDLLPEALVQSPFSVHGVPLPMLTFALAFLTIHIVERSMGMHDAHEGDYAIHRHTRAGVGPLAGSALVIHSFLDGAAIGAAYQTDTSLAVAVAIGVIAHDFTDGFNTYTVTSLYGNARRRALTLLTLDALAPSPAPPCDHPPRDPGRRPRHLPRPLLRLPPLPGHLRYPP